MKRTLIDSGPLVALFDRNDAGHTRVLAFLKGYQGSLMTTWPVLTEVSHLLDFSVRVQIDFYTWIARGGLNVEEIREREWKRIIELTSKYGDRPMDLADASLVILAERRGIRDILTLDKDFLIYRFAGKKGFRNLLEPWDPSRLSS